MSNSRLASIAPNSDRDVVTVAIVTHNSERVLRECLETLPAAFDGVSSYQVIVVDNASTDGTRRLVTEAMPDAALVALAENGGYAAGINAAVRTVADSGPLLVLNPDVRLAPGSVRELARALSVEGAGIAVPRLVGPDGRLQHSLRREPTALRALGEALLGGTRAGAIPLLGEVVTSPSVYERATTAAWATGAAMLIARPCLEAVGPWDESFFLYSEETDFALRARDAGFVLRYVPTATAQHLGGEVASNPQLWTLLTLNRLRLYRRRHGAGRSALFRLAVTINEAARSTRGAPTHRAALRALLRRMPQAQESGPPGYVCFSAQDWWYFNRAHSDPQLMLRVAKTRKVLFVNSITMRMPLPGRSTMPWRRIWRKASSMAKPMRQPVPSLPNFHVMTPVLFPLYGIPWARALNAKLVRLQVESAARRIGLIEPIVVVTIPTAWDAVKEMRRRALIFNRSDRASAFGEADRHHIASLESNLLRTSEKVLYVSHALMAAEAESTQDRAIFLDHGVDLEHFRRVGPAEEPADMQAIPHPRVGFFGGLDDYTVDFGLLERVAEEVPEAQLVLIGDAKCPMERLRRMPNVHWLGFRPYEEIPKYGSGFDVALMPWLDNEWIRNSNPIKMKEYLALGLTVVSTDFPEAAHYKPWLRIASDHDDFIAQVRKALTEPAGAEVEHRRAAVMDASWDRIALRLIEESEGPCAAS